MQVKQPKTYQNVIKLLLPPATGGKRNKDERTMALTSVHDFKRMQKMMKRAGAWLSTESEYFGHRYSQGTSNKKAQKEWSFKIDDPNEHTQNENGVLCLAVKKPLEALYEEKLTR